MILFILLPLLKRSKVGKSCVPVTSQLPGIEVFVALRLLFSSRTICEKCTSALRQHRGSTSKVHFSPITTTFCSTMPDVGNFYQYFLKIFSATSNYISSSASLLIASQDERRLSSVLLRSCTKHYISKLFVRYLVQIGNGACIFQTGLLRTNHPSMIFFSILTYQLF